MFSVLTEGSVLSRGNLYSHRAGGRPWPACRTFVAGSSTFRACHAWRRFALAPWCGPAIRRPGTRLQASLLFGAIKIDEKSIPGNARRAELVDRQRRAAAGGATRRRRHHRVPGAGDPGPDVRGAHARVVSQRTSSTKCAVRKARGATRSARWFFGRSGDNYVALFCALETTWTDNGPWKDKEIRVGGDTNVFITQIGCAAEFGSFERFMAKVSRARVHISGLHSGAELQCSYDVPLGERLELHYDHGSRYGGEPLTEDEYPRHRSPLARIAWQQDRYAIQHGQRSLVHDVVKGTRTTGGVLDHLVHDTPLTFYAQNMGLLPWPLYKGIDRDAALGALSLVSAPTSPTSLG